MGTAATIVKRIDVEEIKRRVTLAEVVAAFAPGSKLRRQGHELIGLSPFKAERTPSFTVDPRKNLFHCFATGHGGDAISFVQILRGCDFLEAARLIGCELLGGVPVTETTPARAEEIRQERAAAQAALAEEDAAEEAAKIAAARVIWERTIPADGTLVETYLAVRGIDVAALADVYGTRVPPSLRFHPWLQKRERIDGRMQVVHAGPAMVGAITDAVGAFCGVHRTWLADHGMGKAAIAKPKMVLGRMKGSAGVLSPFAADLRGLVGEGYETTLTVMGGLARRGIRVHALSALCLGNLAGGTSEPMRPHPLLKGRRVPSERPDPSDPGLTLPAGIGLTTLLEDADGTDRYTMTALMCRAVAKYRAAGHRVAIASPELGCDFNDMARKNRARRVVRSSAGAGP